MKVLNFGSLNYDYVYTVPHIVAPGETLGSTGVKTFCGGKGLNQSVALSRAGVPVFHAGMVGPDGDGLLGACQENGVNTQHILRVQEPSGNAIIQVGEDGQNAIVLFGGANRSNTLEHVDNTLSAFCAGDLILLQNEISHMDYIIRKAKEKGMTICLNPSPFDKSIAEGFPMVDIFLINEVEGEQITGQSDPARILETMGLRYPKAKVVLTLGGEGAICREGANIYRHGAYDIPVIDTTAAGDTFTGYFLASFSRGESLQESLRIASLASAIAVSRHGATPSIPMLDEVLAAELVLKKP